MPYGLYGFGNSPPEDDPQTQQILELLASLEHAPPEQPPASNQPEPSTLQRVLLGGTPRQFAGSLGDAISAMAAVKAGGAPPAQGAYAASQEREALRQAQLLEDYNRRQEENAAADRSLRNTIRVSTFQEGQKQAGAEKIANIKATGTKGVKSEFVRDVGGTPHRFLRLTNPISGETMPLLDPKTGEQVYELDLGEAGYAPGLIPGMMEGEAGVFRVPRGGTGSAKPVTGPGGAKLEPPPPQGMAQEAGGKIGVLQGIPHLKDVYNEVDAKLRGSGKASQVKNWLSAQTAGTRFQTIAMPVEMQKYYSEMRAILAPYVRSVSGLVFPEAELQRYEARMPIPGVTDPSVVDTQWDSLIQEMVRDIKAKYGATGRQAPAIPSGSAPADPKVQEYQQYLDSLKKEMGIANPTP
jgi:hypothetical protein